MTTIHRDDITGEEYEEESSINEFGIISGDIAYDTFETVHPAEIYSEKHVEDTAERLHEMVEDWALDQKKFIRANRE